MRILARTAGLTMLVVILSTHGCKTDPKKQAPAAKKSKQIQAIEVPPAVLAYIGIKNPEQVVDSLLALTKELVPLSFDRRSLLDLLAQKGGLPRDLLGAINTAGHYWLVMLDEKKVGEKDPGVLVIPIRSRKEFETALTQKMKKVKQEGELAYYEPRPEAVGLQKIALLIKDNYVLAPSSKKALEVASTFVNNNLINRQPRYDIAVHLMMEHLMKGPAKNLDREIIAGIKRLRSNMDNVEVAINEKKITHAAEETLKDYVKLLRTTRDLMITVEVDAKQISLSFRGEAQAGGELHQLIKRQRVGYPFGHKLLPASSWLVLTNLSNPEALVERQKSLDGHLIDALKQLDARYRKRLSAVLTSLSNTFMGDLSLAFHPGANGGGFAASVVARVKQPNKVREALDELATLFQEWFSTKQALEEEEKETKGSHRKAPPNTVPESPFKLERKALVWQRMRGTLLELSFPMPPEKQEEITKLIGSSFTLGWIVDKEYALFSAGKNAELQLKQMAKLLKDGGHVPRSLDQNVAFLKAMNAAPGRVGLLYLSLVDLVRWFDSTGLSETEKIATALKGKTFKSAPSIDWGVNTSRSQFDISLHLPIEHFKIFKPIVEGILQQSGPSTLFTPGSSGSEAKWRDVAP